MYIPVDEKEREFLKNYDPNEYEKPSVTVDIVIFTLNDNNKLSVLLIKRSGYPYKDRWAIPGGFVDMKESIDESARRELYEETHVFDVPITQFGTFGDVERDPRMRVISIAYMAFVPRNQLNIIAGDDACDAQIFEIRRSINEVSLIGDRNVTDISKLAFDHNKILLTAIERLYNRIDYTDDAFAFLSDDQSFTIYELKKIYDAVLNTSLDISNFRKDFMRRYVKSGLVIETGIEEKRAGSKRPAKLYKRLK